MARRLKASTLKAKGARKNAARLSAAPQNKISTTSKSESKKFKNLSKLKSLEQINSTAEVPVSNKLIDQVIGQDRAIEVIRKAASQKRNVLLVGTPGTGKSMLAQALAELMPIEELQDIVVVANKEDDNMPKVRALKAGEGRKIIGGERMQARMAAGNSNLMMIGFMMIAMLIGLYILPQYFEAVIVAAMLIGVFLMSAALIFAMQLGRGRVFEMGESMKLIVDNSGKKNAPFVDATGSRAGALLGDVKHDPFQSFDPGTKIELNGKEMSLEAAWREYAKQYPVEKRADGYEAIVLPKKANARIKAQKGRKLKRARLLIINRRPYEGKVVKIKAGKHSLKTTPEHAFISNPSVKKAKKLRKGSKVFVAA